MRRTAIGILGLVNVAALIATSPPPGWSLEDSVRIDDLRLTPDAPEVEIVVALDVGEGLLTDAYQVSGILDIDGKNHGGDGNLEVWLDDTLLSSLPIRDARPRNFALSVGVGLEPVPEEILLTLRVDGEADLEGFGTLTVTVYGEGAPDGDSTFGVEIRPGG